VTAAKPRKGEPIRLDIVNGQPRYRARVDVAVNGQGRAQVRKTFDTLTAARAWVATAKHKREAGEVTATTVRTFSVEVEDWLRRKGRGELGARIPRPTTMRGYRDGLAHAREAFGDRPLGKVTRADVTELRASMLAAGLTGRTIGHTLMLTRAVLAEAVRSDRLARNVAEGIDAPAHTPTETPALTEAEVGKVRKVTEADRLAACWALSLVGLRRSEVLGLHWGDLDLGPDPSLTVARSRVIVPGKGTAYGKPKTARGARTLPLSADLAALLRTWRATVADAFGLAAVKPDQPVAVDGAGRPVSPEWYSDEWLRIVKQAEVRPVTLRSARASSVTALRLAGVDDLVVAAWHGHDEAVMRKHYSKANADPLRQAAETLAEVTRSG